MIRTKNKIYAEANDVNTVLMEDTPTSNTWLLGNGNKAIKAYEPGPNKILIISTEDNETYYVTALSYLGKNDSLLGTDSNGDIVFISRTTGNVILTDDDIQAVQ